MKREDLLEALGTIPWIPDSKAAREQIMSVIQRVVFRDVEPGDPDTVIKETRRYGDTVGVDLWYPRSEGRAKFIEVGLMDVRAADAIRISYDFERDGYVIEQASTFQWESDDKEQDEDWQEVTFVQAWARQKDEETL
jgi:hypothetical protein